VADGKLVCLPIVRSPFSQQMLLQLTLSFSTCIDLGIHSILGYQLIHGDQLCLPNTVYTILCLTICAGVEIYIMQHLLPV